MISWLMQRVQTLVLDPQTVRGGDVADDHVCTMALNTTQADPLQAMATSDAEIRMESGGTRPIAGTREIGGGVQLRHTITITVRVVDGDPVEGDSRRDGIVTDLVLRLVRNPTLGDAISTDGLQELTQPMDWQADYTPLGTGLPESFAVLTLSADVDLASLRGR